MRAIFTAYPTLIAEVVDQSEKIGVVHFTLMGWCPTRNTGDLHVSD
jgi:hypothetical protein